MNVAGTELLLLCRAHTRLCGLPLQNVVETCRPLPLEPVLSAPSFVIGVAVIRGQPLPVVDVAMLLGDRQEVTRFVTVRLGQRQVALAFASVEGVGDGPAAPAGLPPLLTGAQRDAISSLEMLDGELLVLLNAVTLLDVAVG